ncbi:putative F-box protein At1g47300 [Papaver somniferum]|uniref:putative F-box protein At1g47300 n=1 Tax=Papaver somniferum TaxID=3469 RepID=UPI000E6F627F|nr:putative F-box protein At1g47300 [Papaver somniferum]
MVDPSSCSAIKEDGLPEGILFEIFLKLPWKSINRFKCVSKVWLSIISDPNFMKNKFKTLFIEPKPWVIFSNHVIPNQHHPSDIIIPSRLFHTQFMSSGNELSGYDGFSFNFLRKSYGSDAQHRILHVLASRSGLVLCSVINYSKESTDYFVCNPITNESVSLPPPPTKGVGRFTWSPL